jgi:nucleotide-binding universal stress UspA family protein
MKKILVTTDFSKASNAGLRFAIQFATQSDVELVFFHCFQALIPTTVLYERIALALKDQGDLYMKKLQRLVARTHRNMKVEPGTHHCVVVESLDPEKAIMHYAEEHGFQYICMSTRGAGAIRKVVGTHTGSVLRHASIPVLVVPHSYRVQPIKKVLYSTDLEHFDKEMSLVTAFAERLNVKVDLAHFFFAGEVRLDEQNLKQLWRLKYPQLSQVYLEPYHIDKGFPVQLNQLVKKTRPSIVAFFTHDNKTWYDKLFGTSVSENVSYVTKVPMLVLRKGSK